MSMQMPYRFGRDFDSGVEAGAARAEREGLNVEPYADFGFEAPEWDSPLRYASTRLEVEEASSRFTELFAEMLTVAVLARHTYDDPPLAEPEVDSYLTRSFSFFNSFRHA